MPHSTKPSSIESSGIRPPSTKQPETKQPEAGPSNSRPLILAASTSSRQGGLCLMQDGATLYTEAWQLAAHSENIVPAYQKLLQATGIQSQDIQAYALNIGPGSFTGLRVGVNFVRSLAYLFDKPIYTLNSMQVLAFEVFQKHPDCQLCCVMVDAFKNQVYTQCFTRNLVDKQADKAANYVELNHEARVDGHPAVEVSSTQGPQCVEASKIAQLFNSIFIQTRKPVEGDLTTSFASTHLQDQSKSLSRPTSLCAGNGWAKYQHIFLPDLKVNFQPVDLVHPCAEVLAQQALQHSQPLKWPRLQPFYLRASSAEEARVAKQNTK